MPKYIPKPDDMYSTKPCFICGLDVLDEDSDTCCPLCEQMKKFYEEDYEYYLQRQIEQLDSDF